MSLLVVGFGGGGGCACLFAWLVAAVSDECCMHVCRVPSLLRVTRLLTPSGGGWTGDGFALAACVGM